MSTTTKPKDQMVVTEDKVATGLRKQQQEEEADEEKLDDFLGMEDTHEMASGSAHQHVSDNQQRCEHVGFMLMMCLSFLSFVPLVIWEGQRDLGDGKGFFKKVADEWVNEDHASKVVGVGHLMFIPFACPVMMFLLWHVDRVIQQRKPSKVKVFSQAIALTVVIQLRIAVSLCIKETYQAYVMFYVEFALWLICLSIWFGVIKHVLARAVAYLQAMDGAVTSHKEYKKWVSIMTGFTRFKDHKGKNAIYSFTKPNTAAQVVELYLHFYAAAFRVVPSVLFCCWYFGVTVSGNFMLIGILSLLGTSIAFATVGMKNLLSIVISKPFYLGDLIEFDGIVGFVENFTWSHIVIRDFACMQTWVTHSTFEGTTVKNWTRRNTKPIFLQCSINAFTPPTVVHEFVMEANKLVTTNEKIDQKGYMKVAIESLASGYVLTSLFFPAPGAWNVAVREKYLLDLMKIAAAKKIEIVPMAMQTGFANSASSLPNQALVTGSDNI